MLRFFRQIRKSLMEQDKLRTYLFYAVGEILLVVIGILIALQINNWNEKRQEDNRRVQLLENIRSDYQRNEVRLLAAYEQSASINTNTLRLMELISYQITTVSIDSLMIYWDSYIEITTFSPLNSSYLTAQSTGDIGLIIDKELLELFIEFQEANDWLNFHVELSRDMVYLGNVWDLRKKLGSLNIMQALMVNVDPHPPGFRFNDSEIRQFLFDKETFAAIESMYWINRNILRSILSMQEVNSSILNKIDELL